ncbi:MAG: hypothetical protein ACKVP7_11700 [Hyphomicrobiaceae bacterium]
MATIPEAGIVAISAMFEQVAGRGEASRALLNAAAMAVDQITPILEELLQVATDGLKRNAYYKGETALFIDAVLLHTLRYLESRHDLSVASAQTIEFLFNRDSSNPPLEKDLQQDFHGSLLVSLFRLGFSTEARDLGGGRVDVLFAWKGLRISAELKREERDRSDEQLVDDYGPQAISYQGTNVPICFLMVLDLFDRGGSQAHLREQVTVHHRTPAGTRTPHTIVLVRIQGRRKSPSKL